MTYNRTLQRMFVTGRYSSIVLSVLSLLLWGIGAFLPYNVQEGTANAFFVSSIGVYACRALSLLLYVGVAFIINSFIILEERTPWLAGLLLLLAAFFAQFKVVAVGGLVVVDASHGDLYGAVSDHIHELAVVADDDHCLRRGFDEFLKPLDTVYVEVVRWLVEQQNVWIL